MSENFEEGMQTNQASRAWFVVAGGGLLLGILVGNPTLVGIALLLTVAVVLAWLWARYALTNITFERMIVPDRANWGEEVEYSLRVTNRKALPLAWLEVVDELPRELNFTRGSINKVYKPNRSAADWRVALGWYERVTRHYVIRADQRGAHDFGPVVLRAGDIFGLFSRGLAIKNVGQLLVYPRVVPLEALNIPAREPFGESKAMLPLVADPLRPQGTRPYVPGDSPRHIHWRASARSTELQTRLFDPVATPQVWLFLNQQTFEHEYEGIDPAGLELAIVVAASLANYALEQGFAVALEANAPTGASDQHVRIGPSTSPEQLTRILEALARLIGWSGTAIEAIIERTRRSLPWGASVVVVSTTVSDWLLQILLALRRSGHPVTLIEVRSSGQQAVLGDTGALGITYYRVTGVGEEPYREVESLALA